MALSVQFREHGSTDVLEVVEGPDPEPGAGQVRVGVRAIGVNPFDWKLLHGYVPGMPKQFPAGLGSDIAGVVDAIGDGVTSPAVGEEVLGQSAGPAYTTAALATADALVPRPPGVAWEIAASLGAAGGTAWKVLDVLGVREGETLLVHAAAGGVGTFAVQLAIARGARVIGTASERNHDFLRSLGAEPTTYGHGLVERVRELAPDGVDRALDTAGRGALPDLIELTGDAGNVVTIADFSAPKLCVRVSSGGGTERAYYALADAARYAQEGRFSLPVERTFSFADAPEAHRVSEAGHVRGKLVLVP
jgi:NADPH:quinone reductase-like Zn-dependent oxidoreductase